MTNRHNDRPRVREYALDDCPPPGYEKRVDERVLFRGGQPRREDGRTRSLRDMTIGMVLRSIGFQTR